MPKYLVTARFTDRGLQEILKEGGSRRAGVLGNVVLKLGGAVEAIYFALGETDAYMIVNLPNHVSASAYALETNATGNVSVRTTVLLTPEEIDQATQMMAKFH